ncbi:MAG TPA: peptide-methionine (S)-S-oxide reductase MsrA [Vicinamibacterales bacterium]
MHPQRWILLAALVIAVAYVWLRGGFVGITEMNAAPAQAVAPVSQVEGQGQAVATFASGCFWCTEADFDKVRGVVSTTSGYTGGKVPTPTYRQVSSGGTGHAEAVRVVFDPSVVTYEQLLEQFWHNVDPFVANRQFCDVGNQYRPEIFFHNDAQRVAAEASKARMQKLFRERIVVAITPAGSFYPAETYHQDYYKKNSAQYRFYRYGCGRDRRLQEIWAEIR